MMSSGLPGRSLWISAGAGFLLSIGIGTLMMASTELVDEATFIGVFLGGVLAGQLALRPLRRAGLAGVLAALLSFFAYFQIVPALIESGIIAPPPEQQPDIYELLFSVVVYVGIFLALGAAGGAIGGYLRGLIRPPRVVVSGRCPNCNSVLPGEAVFCPYCGKRVQGREPAAHQW